MEKNFGTCKTEERDMDEERVTEHDPAMVDKEPSALLTSPLAKHVE